MCCIFPTRRHALSEHQTTNSDLGQATPASSTPKRQSARLIKLNPLARTKPVQTRDASIPLPPKYRSRGSNIPRVQDVTDPAVRSLLFGPFAQIDHHQHCGFAFDGRPNTINQNSGCAGIGGCTCGKNHNSTNSIHQSSTCSTKDDPGSGGHNISLHG